MSDMIALLHNEVFGGPATIGPCSC